MGSGISTEPFPGKCLIQGFFMSGDQHGLNPDQHHPSHTPDGSSTSMQCLSSVADGAGVTSLALSFAALFWLRPIPPRLIEWIRHP